MRVYVGQTRSKALVTRLQRLGIREMTVRGELPPRRFPWAYDNGAFRDWTAKEAFDSEAFIADISLMQTYTWKFRPDFIAVPDHVACGLESLAYSVDWLERYGHRWPAPPYLVLQDGMTPENIDHKVRHFAGLFIGGTLQWKIKTGAEWIRYAMTIGLPVHVGRCGTANRVKWARRCGAASLDSSLPLWSEDNLQRFLGGLEPSRQGTLADLDG